MVLGFLSDSCDVSRRSAAAQGYGSKPTYAAAHLIAEPCRLIESSQKGFNSITAQWLTEAAFKMLVLPETDIQDGDRITNIKLKDGTIFSQNFEVDGGALQHRGRMVRHRVLLLKKVS